MKRRQFLRGLALLAACPTCAGAARAGESSQGRTHWSYQGESGTDQWGNLEDSFARCAVGSQQSPIDISGAVKADLPALHIDWKKGGTIVNNGHTIQVNVTAGGTLQRGPTTFELVQYHFHAPSEHLVDGMATPMEVHFVHKDIATGNLGVLGVFIRAGRINDAFKALAEAFPQRAGQEAELADADPSALLPAGLSYWTYEGSLTTPPCSEIVTWMVAMDPIEVDEADIASFTRLYSLNARPILAANRRYILASD